MQQTKSYTVASVAMLLVLALLVGSWSYFAIWVGDDIVYGFFCDGTASDNYYHPFKAINSLWEIFVSQYNHYIGTNGRYVAHWIVQWFIVFGGRALFSVVNALVYVVCAVYILRLANLKWNKHPMALFFTIAILLISFRTKFTPSCQIGFIWMFTLSAICIDIFLNKKDVKAVWFVPLAVFAFLAGWGQEALCLGVAAAMCLYVLDKRFKLTCSQWIIVVCYCLGTLILAIAPSNFVRASGSSIGYSVVIMRMSLLHRMLYLLVIIYIYIYITRRATLLEMYRNDAFYIHAFIVLLVFNIMISVYSNRQLFGIEFLSLIISVRLLSQYGAGRVACIVGILALCVYIGSICVFNYSYLLKQKYAYTNIKEQYKESSDGIVFYDIFPQHSIFCSENPAPSFGLAELFSMEKLWKHEGGKKTLCVAPTCLKGLTDKKLKTQVVRLDDETYMLISSFHNPAKQFRLHCYSKLGFLKKQSRDCLFVPDSDGDRLSYNFRIKCKHFCAAITGGDQCVKYISGVDIEY